MNEGFLSYKAGNSLFHKCPSWIKILFIPCFSILIFILPVWFTVLLVIVQFIVQLSLHFSLRDFYYDLRPVLFYAVLLYITKIISKQFNDGKTTLYFLMKIFCMLQSASIMYKTSTVLELREGFEKIENSIKIIIKYKFSIAQTLSIFVIFIPMLSRIWTQSKKAWVVRGGKKNIKMFIVLLNMLFTTGLKKAWNNSRAIQIRS
ncbi:MAG: hypothetical protein IKX23_04295 [Treponema sp.]|nr:hypothetical protein [Treponema sp.]